MTRAPGYCTGRQSLISLVFQIGGMREGDYLVTIRDQDVKWSSHASVVKEIKESENNLRLRLVTPLDKSLLKLNNHKVIRADCQTVFSSFCCFTERQESRQLQPLLAQLHHQLLLRTLDVRLPGLGGAGDLLTVVQRVLRWLHQGGDEQLQQEILAQDLQHQVSRAETFQR